MIRKYWLVLLLVFFSSDLLAGTTDKKCLLVMSYHQGYEWNDGIERGVIKSIGDSCTLKIFYMDTKRNPSEKFGKQAALKAKALIATFKPDIVIASDDNASRYLIKPYYKNASLPVVFCGINWTAAEYGYPYNNATGMLEVAPIVPQLKVILLSHSYLKEGVYLSSDVITEHKDYKRYNRVYQKHGIKLTPVFVSTMQQWKKEYLKAQQKDFIILNNYSGINDWNQSDISRFVSKNSTILTITNYQWMMPYSMLGMTKSAEEQGNWAGKVARSVINGVPINTIPITINKTWNLFVNLKLLKNAGVKLNPQVINRAYKKW